MDMDFAVSKGALVLDLHFCLKKSVILESVIFYDFEYPLTTS